MTPSPRPGSLRARLAHPMARRIMAATGSNAYAQATSIAMQLLSLPLFLSQWDVATYGQWLVLSAIPAYLAMGDVGMVTAAGNRMTMLVGDGRHDEANRVFQSALAFVLGVGSALLLLVAAAVWLWPAGGALPAQPGSRAVVLVLSATVVVTLVGGFPEAVYKATHRYALGAALANTTRLLEWAGGLVGLWLFGDFLTVALGALLARVLCTGAMVVHAARTTPQFRWAFEQADRAEIRACAKPAISFMAFPAANALNHQGMTLVAAAVLGPAAAVVFNTYRTIARVTVQATGVFSSSLWPEFSRIFGARDLAALQALYRRGRRLGLALAVVASAVVYVAAPTVLELWAQGKIAFDPPLMLTAMVYAAAAGAWHVSRVLLLSTNQHAALAWPFLVLSAACVPIAWLLAHPFGLIGVVAVMLALELVMLVYCAALSQRLLHPSLRTTSVGAAA